MNPDAGDDANNVRLILIENFPLLSFETWEFFKTWDF